MLNTTETFASASIAPSPPSADILRDAILSTLNRMKGENTLTIDLVEKSDVTSFMIISSGQSTTKVGAMAQEVRKTLKEVGAEIINVDGTGNKDWVLIDANDCIIHLFRPAVREFYNLEKLWAPELAIQRDRDGTHVFDIESEPALLAEDDLLSE
ncbi:MAG: ribosome silencing factor [Alphaproteobacteria bacterium]